MEGLKANDLSTWASDSDSPQPAPAHEAMPSVRFSPLEELPTGVALGGPLGEQFASIGQVCTLVDAAAWLRALPYGEPADFQGPDAALLAMRGSCVDKHRALVGAAQAAGRSDIVWVKGYYQLTDELVPGISAGLSAAGIGPPFVPVSMNTLPVQSPPLLDSRGRL